MRILYITTIGPTMGFFRSLIYKLIQYGDTVDIAANITKSDVPKCYRDWNCKIYSLSCTRSPFNNDNLLAIKEIRHIVKEGNYDIVHCHTPVAGVCTRIACRKLRRNGLKVFYTAHGFHFYKGAPLKNWFIYYPIEWLCARWTDVLITINKEDYACAKKHLHAKRVEYVPGVGIDLKKFSFTIPDEEKCDKCDELGIFKQQSIRKSIDVPLDSILLLSVGELNTNKNHEVVIRALAKITNTSIHYAIAGTGVLHDYLIDLANSLDIEDRVHLLGLRNDVADLYKAADICVFPSIREGLGLAAIEGMASGLPLICADNRGTRDYAIDGENAIVCDYKNVDQFAKAIQTILSDTNLIRDMKKLNVEKAKKYDINNIIAQMKEIYGEVLNR